MLPTVGGQTALNLAVALAERGVLEKYNVKLIGASIEAIKVAEDRLLFKRRDAGDRPRRAAAAAWRSTLDEALALVEDTRLSRHHPAVVHAGRRRRRHRLQHRRVPRAGRARPRAQPGARECSIEESVIGWKEFELEVMRDVADNFVVICSIENIDPMGVHTGDSITVAPALTLTDKEYQRMRDAARRIIRRVGVETGGSNIQFAVNPADGRMVVIEMNPRVSRSSALASKATGFPIAKIAAKLALGYHLDEIPNDITRLTPASFEPTIDYVVVKIPAMELREVPAGRSHADDADEVGGRGDGDRPHVQGSVPEGRAIARARQAGHAVPVRTERTGDEDEDDAALRKRLVVPERPADVGAVPRARPRLDRRADLHELTKIDPLVPAAVRARSSSCGGWRRSASSASCRPICLRR